jgi:Permuted papain-like amidase enzyme, YaeF/YiiX, C92 family
LAAVTTAGDEHARIDEVAVMTTPITGRPGWRPVTRAATLAAALAALLAIPWPAPAPPAAAGRTPFAWRQDERWRALETAFRSARAAGCPGLAPRIGTALAAGDRLLAAAAARPLEPDAAVLTEIEQTVFDLGPMVAACADRLPEYVEFVARLRSVVKRQSQHWDMGSPATRDRLYRLLYGSRAALEEAMLQAPPGAVPALGRGDDEPSATPGAEVLGVRIHSGDILVSRGGAPTSALIARGNDYPGNFSHAALVHVDERTGQVSVAEAHIERGVVVSSLAEYLRDVKLRVMVLRPRTDLPRVDADPMLPHEAAAAALAAARRRHIAYDFAMDKADHSRQFCSEVVSAAYETAGVTLWTGLSHISSPGLAAWLAGFGVRHFETEEPSDLEYDPQLRVVAEWRDPEALFSDHVDNAVVDAMLEGAEAGDPLTYPVALLPAARLAKAYSWLLNRAGAVGPVPEGLSAAGALRNRAFTRTHAAIKARVLRLADGFARRHGYRPPYWELVALARQARAELTGGSGTPAQEGGTG